MMKSYRMYDSINYFMESYHSIIVVTVYPGFTR